MRRSIDASKIFDYLEANGWTSTDRISKADIIIIYACGGFHFSALRSFKTIERALAQKKNNTKVIVTGCLLKIDPSAVEALEGIDVIPEDRLYDNLDTFIQAEKSLTQFPDVNAFRKIRNLDDYSLAWKFFYRFTPHAAFFKSLPMLLVKRIQNRKISSYVLADDLFKIDISRGCLGNCTYCAMKFASGKLRSKSPEKIVEEFKKGLDLGFDRFVFICHELGCYGRDRGSSFADLLTEIFKEKRPFKLVLNDFNIQWLVKDEELMRLLVENRDKIAEIRMPIQTGSNKVLTLMNRHYTKEGIRSVLKQLNEKMPEVEIHTHFIVGFPGETPSDFLDTKRLIRDFKFTKIDVFCYQDRPGIKSTLLPDKISTKVKIKRAQELAGLGNYIDLNY